MNRRPTEVDPKREMMRTYRGLLPVLAVIALGLGLVWYVGKTSSQTKQGEGVAQRVRDGIARLSEVDPALLKYQEYEPIRLSLEKPTAISVGRDGKLYANGDRRLLCFDLSGKQLFSVDLAAEPYCVAADSSGMLYVGFRDHVEVLGPDHKLQSQWAPTSAKAYLTCIAVSGDDVFVADAGDRSVFRFDRGGAQKARIGAKGEGSEGLVLPSPHLDVSVHPDGQVVVNNPGLRRVEVYTKDGVLLGFWGKAGQGIEGFRGCCNPTDIALLPDGGIVTAEKGLLRVKTYDPEGALQAVVAQPSDFSQANDSLDLAVAADERVLVLDRQAKSVRVFDVGRGTAEERRRSDGGTAVDG